MEKEGFGEEFSICSAVFFWRNLGGFKKFYMIYANYFYLPITTLVIAPKYPEAGMILLAF